MADAREVSPMLADIARQPDVLRALAADIGRFVALGRERLRPGAGGALFVAGCGDGWFAAQAAEGFARARGLDWRPIGALDLVLRAATLRTADRVLAISMSGNVDRTVEAAQAAAAAGVAPAALVNGRGGRLAAASAATISLDLPDVAPFLCGTASYTATLAALLGIAAGAAGGSDAPLAAGFAAAAAAQTAAIGQRDAFAPVAPAPSGIRFLSAGAERGTAQYGAAKCVELARVPVWAGDLEEFAHSQYWSMPASDLVVVVATEPAVARYASDACAALAELGVTSFAVDSADAAVAGASRRATLPAIPAGFAPLASAVPLQFLAYAVATATGFDPDARGHLRDDAARFRVSRLLTRRSLVGTGS